MRLFASAAFLASVIVASSAACTGGGGSIGSASSSSGSSSGDGGIDTGGCPTGQKRCADGACVSARDPLFGCGNASCEPCRDIPNLNPLCGGSGGRECAWQSCTDKAMDCDGDRGNGCETFTYFDPKNCGACGNVCPAYPSGKGACVGGKCEDQGCSDKLVDCNGDPADGCEKAIDGSDAQNCGACGLTCASGACVDGVCTAEVLPMTGVDSPNGLVVASGAELFIIDSRGGTTGQIRKVPLAGGASTLVAEAPGQNHQIAVDATDVYFSNRPDGADPSGIVYQVKRDGTCDPVAPCPKALATARFNPSSLAVDDAYVYWVEFGTLAQNFMNGGVYRIKKDGTGLLETLHAPIGDVGTMAITATGSVFFGSMQGLQRVGKDGTNHTILSPAITRAVAVDGADVFGTHDSSTMAVAQNASAGTTPRAVWTRGASRIAIADGVIYGAGAGNNFNVVASSKTDGTCANKGPCPAPLARIDISQNSRFMQSFAVGPGFVYATGQNKTIVRIPR